MTLELLKPLRVHVGGVAFEAAPAVGILDGYEGYGIVEGGFTGWWSRPGARGGQTARPASHGDFDERLFLGGRVVTISGIVVASRRARAALCDRLSGLGAGGERVRIEVSRDGASTWAWCRVVSNDVDVESSAAHPTFLITLRCANPRRFGETRQSPATASGVVRVFENRGNFAASPRWRVTGPQPGGYSIFGQGEAPSLVPSALPAGSTDLVDFASGLVLRNGSPLVGTSSELQEWTVPPGTKEWSASLTGSGSIVGELADTFV